MEKLKAFMEVPRLEAGYRPLHERIHDFGEVEQTLNSRDRMAQASRCMDCGVPFCHWACPLGNKDPEWNDAIVCSMPRTTSPNSQDASVLRSAKRLAC